MVILKFSHVWRFCLLNEHFTPFNEDKLMMSRLWDFLIIIIYFYLFAGFLSVRWEEWWTYDGISGEYSFKFLFSNCKFISQYNPTILWLLQETSYLLSHSMEFISLYVLNHCYVTSLSIFLLSEIMPLKAIDLEFYWKN